jgi:pilus assembly protein Flp/PilA
MNTCRAIFRLLLNGPEGGAGACSHRSKKWDRGDKEQESFLAMKSMFLKFLSDEVGATAIEYGLIAALISVVIIATITAVGTQLSATFNTISTAISGANS